MRKAVAMLTKTQTLRHYEALASEAKASIPPTEWEPGVAGIDWDDPTEWDVPSNDYFDR